MASTLLSSKPAHLRNRKISWALRPGFIAMNINAANVMSFASLNHISLISSHKHTSTIECPACSKIAAFEFIRPLNTKLRRFVNI